MHACILRICTVSIITADPIHMVTYSTGRVSNSMTVQDIECSVDISHHFCGSRNVAGAHPSSRSGTEGRRGEGKGGIGREGRREE